MGQDVLLTGRSCGCLELSGESIRLDVLVSCLVGQGAVEPCEEQYPSGLTGVQPLGGVEVLKVAMVSKFNKRMLTTSQWRHSLKVNLMLTL